MNRLALLCLFLFLQCVFLGCHKKTEPLPSSWQLKQGQVLKYKEKSSIEASFVVKGVKVNISTDFVSVFGFKVTKVDAQGNAHIDVEYKWFAVKIDTPGLLKGFDSRVPGDMKRAKAYLKEMGMELPQRVNISIVVRPDGKVVESKLKSNQITLRLKKLKFYQAIFLHFPKPKLTLGTQFKNTTNTISFSGIWHESNYTFSRWTSCGTKMCGKLTARNRYLKNGKKEVGNGTGVVLFSPSGFLYRRQFQAQIRLQKKGTKIANIKSELQYVP